VSNASSPPDDDDGISRKTLVRILVVLGIGIPLLVEGITFAGLLSSQLLGDGGGDAGTPTATPTERMERVGEGDELLAATPQADTVTSATLTAESNSWVFTLSVRVNNTSNHAYQLQLQSVTTTGGRQIDEVSTVTVLAGEQGTVTGQWRLPPGERPESITVLAIQQGTENRTATTTQEEVPLGNVPVQGR
jgi:uncharacterized protein affecting Mg2+/Co2+ transport